MPGNFLQEALSISSSFVPRRSSRSPIPFNLIRVDGVRLNIRDASRILQEARNCLEISSTFPRYRLGRLSSSFLASIESLTQTARGREEQITKERPFRVIEAQQRSEGTSISILSVDTLLNDLANKSIDLSATNTFPLSHLSSVFPLGNFQRSARSTFYLGRCQKSYRVF